MKRKIAQRCLMGFPIGVTIGYGVTLLVSLGWGNGAYLPCVPELTAAMGGELRAVLVQALLCGVLGMGFAASSVIWEMDAWSMAKQTAVYFAVISVIMLPIAYSAYWMEHSVAGFLRYFAVFALIFAVMWGVQYAAGKRAVRRMNERIGRKP